MSLSLSPDLLPSTKTLLPTSLSMYSCNAIERELSESVSRKVGQILEVDFYNSLKEGEPERRLTNKSSNLESYLSSENKKRLEETYCSTEGPSSSKSQLEKTNEKVKKTSYFSKGQKVKLQNLDLNEVKSNPTMYELIQNNICNSCLQKEVYFKEESESESLQNSNNSECSDVEFFLDNNSKKSSKTSRNLKVTNEVTSWQKENIGKKNLDIDEPSVSHSSGCNFSFEYLIEKPEIIKELCDISCKLKSFKTNEEQIFKSRYTTQSSIRNLNYNKLDTNGNPKIPQSKSLSSFPKSSSVTRSMGNLGFASTDESSRLESMLASAPEFSKPVMRCAHICWK